MDESWRESLEAVATRLGGRVERGKRAFRDRGNLWAGMDVGRRLFGWGPVSVIARPGDREVMLRFHRGGRLAVDLVYRGPQGFRVREDGTFRGRAPEGVEGSDELLRILDGLRPIRRLFFDLYLIEYDTGYDPDHVDAEEIAAKVEALCAAAALLESSRPDVPGS